MTWDSNEPYINKTILQRQWAVYRVNVYIIDGVDDDKIPELFHIFNSIQFNSNTLFKDGDPVSLQLIFPGAWSKHVNKYNNYSNIYTKQHRFIGHIQANTTYTFIQKHIHKHSYLTYTMYIQTCTFTTLYHL